MNQFIPLSQAIAMTSLYRAENERILDPLFRNMGILPICETFDRSAFDTLLAENGATFIRIYFGMGQDLKVRVLAVAADANGADILPSSLSLTPTGSGDGSIVEEGQRCPDICPPPGPLNS